MSNNFLFSSIFELIMAAFIIWGVFNEQKLVDFEDKIIGILKAALRRRRFVRQKRNIMQYRRRTSGKFAS